MKASLSSSTAEARSLEWALANGTGKCIAHTHTYTHTYTRTDTRTNKLYMNNISDSCRVSSVYSDTLAHVCIFPTECVWIVLFLDLFLCGFCVAVGSSSERVCAIGTLDRLYLLIRVMFGNLTNTFIKNHQMLWYSDLFDSSTIHILIYTIYFIIDFLIYIYLC